MTEAQQDAIQEYKAVMKNAKLPPIQERIAGELEYMGNCVDCGRQFTYDERQRQVKQLEKELKAGIECDCYGYLCRDCALEWNQRP